MLSAPETDAIVNELYDLLLDIFEGKKAGNEERGDKQIAILKTGVTL